MLQDRVETKVQQSNTGQHIRRKQAQKNKNTKFIKLKKKKKYEEKSFFAGLQGRKIFEWFKKKFARW